MPDTRLRWLQARAAHGARCALGRLRGSLQPSYALRDVQQPPVLAVADVQAGELVDALEAAVESHGAHVQR
jgi:hypothetical protein